MDEENIERWITVNGRHIPILKGESEKEALNRFYSRSDIESTMNTNDIDIEIETEDENIPYEKIYYTYFGPSRSIVKDKEKAEANGYKVFEFELTAEMKDTIDDILKSEYIEDNNIRGAINVLNNKLFQIAVNGSDRRMIEDYVRPMIIDACASEAQKWLDKLPKNENKSIERCLADTNSIGYAESHKAIYNSKEYNYYTSNCQRCIIAYEMRRRGYDVEANKYKGRADEIYNTRLSLTRSFLNYDYYKNTKEYNTQPNGEKYSSRGALIKAMVKDMINEGEGARFVLSWDWKNSSWGHTVNAEIVNGEVKIFDAQINKEYSIKDMIERKDLRATTLKCTRVDNLKLSNRLEDIIKWKQ